MPILKTGHLFLAEATQRTYETVRSQIFLCDRPSKFMVVSKTNVIDTFQTFVPVTPKQIDFRITTRLEINVSLLAPFRVCETLPTC